MVYYVLLIAALAVQAAPQASRGAAEIAGTYQVEVCRGVCSTNGGEPDRTGGMLVLDTVRSLDLRGQGSFAGCHTVAMPGQHQQQVDPTRFGWQRPVGTDSIQFAMWSGIDYGVAARLVFTDSGLVGQVQDWSAYSAPSGTGIRQLSGRRVGPPDQTLCLPLHHSEWRSVLGFVVGALGLGVFMAFWR